MQRYLRLHLSKHFLVRTFQCNFELFPLLAPDWSVPLRASPSKILVSEHHFICFCRSWSVLEIKCCVSIGVDNLSEGPVWLLVKLLHYLWEYCLLSKKRNPFRMNPQIFSFPWVWGDSWIRSLRGVCEDVICAIYLSISVNNNVELSSSHYFQTEDSTKAFRWLEASRQK
jgi:hypothetical protein